MEIPSTSELRALLEQHNGPCISMFLPTHRAARYHDDDLLDIAATQTLLHSGSVYAVEQAKVPGGELVAQCFATDQCS